MNEIFEMMNFGKRIEAHGEKWAVLKSFYNGFCLAIKANEEIPCQVYLIKEKEAENDT